MSESTAAVSAPGLPGVTAVETGINDGVAKAPVQSTYVSDTTGMSESQAAALAFVDKNRAEAAFGSDIVIKRQAQQALDHAFRGGPNPDFLASREQQRADAARNDNRTLAESDGDIPIGAGLDPMSPGDVERLVTRGVVAGQMPRESATVAAEFCQSAQLPVTVANALMDRAAKHFNGGLGFGIELSAADVEDLKTECIRSFGTEEKAEAEVALARKYLESVGGAKLLAEVDEKAGSLGFDPRLILQLSYMARAKRIK